MKLLMIYTDRFAWTTGHKAQENTGDDHEGQVCTDTLVGFIHAESGDPEEMKKVETKLVKNLKWGARKNDTQRILLHTFSHLAETKATPEFTREILDRTEQRLSNAGYDVRQTPFGYFLNLDLSAPGVPSARIFTSF
jgi:hypothetical protein